LSKGWKTKCPGETSAPPPGDTRQRRGRFSRRRDRGKRPLKMTGKKKGDETENGERVSWIHFDCCVVPWGNFSGGLDKGSKKRKRGGSRSKKGKNIQACRRGVRWDTKGRRVASPGGRARPGVGSNSCYAVPVTYVDKQIIWRKGGKKSIGIPVVNTPWQKKVLQFYAQLHRKDQAYPVG